MMSYSSLNRHTLPLLLLCCCCGLFPAGALMVGDTLFRSADGSSHCPVCKGKVRQHRTCTHRTPSNLHRLVHAAWGDSL